VSDPTVETTPSSDQQFLSSVLDPDPVPSEETPTETPPEPVGIPGEVHQAYNPFSPNVSPVEASPAVPGHTPGPISEVSTPTKRTPAKKTAKKA
jgi:hypothetical protein